MSQQWMTRAEAAAVLKVSARQVDRYRDAGKLTDYRAPGRGHLGLRLDSAEVERLRDERDNPRPRAQEAP